MRAAALALAASLALPAGSAAQQRQVPPGERWQAISTVTSAFTGDITFAPSRITFPNGRALPLEAAGSARVAEQATGQRVQADLYRVAQPQPLTILRGNRLCDGAAIHWVAVWRSRPILSDADPRGLALFGGEARPAEAARPCDEFRYEARPRR